jgi:hypothetical protein
VRSAPRTRRVGARVSWLSLKTKVDGFSSLGLKTKVDGFSILGLKTGSSDLVICISKLSRRFFGLDHKTKWIMVCRLRYKTNGRWTAQDTRQDLMACFTGKQVKLGFTSLPQN